MFKKVSEVKVTTQALGTKDLDEVLDLAEEGLKATKDALANGSITWIDIPKFAPVISKVSPAMEGIKNVWPELKDLDAEEAAHVYARMTVIITLATSLFPAPAA